MKKFCSVIFSLIFIFNIYSNDSSSKIANRKTAMRYLQLAKNYVAQENWPSVKITTENGLKYDDSIADLYYLKALSLVNLDSPRFDVISVLYKSLENREWVDYNATNARVFYADLLSLTGKSQEALEVLDRAPFIYSADAEYVRIKSLYQINSPESITKAEEKIESARRVYPKDIRFFYLFFFHEYNISYVEKEDKSGFEKRPLSPLAQKIANSFIYNIPNYDKEYKDLEIIASSFAQGEERRRLLKAFDARGFKHILYPIFALEENIFTQEEALDYFLTFIDGEIDSKILFQFYSMITEENLKKYFDENLNAFKGTLVYDTNNTLEANLFVKYERGRAVYVTFDSENDQYIEWDIYCDFGEPKKMNLYSENALIQFKRFPNVSLCEFKGLNKIFNKDIIIEMIDDEFLCEPFKIVKTPFVKSTDFYVIDESTLNSGAGIIDGDKIFNSANKIIMTSIEKPNATIEYSILNSKPYRATYKANGKIYAECQYFENSDSVVAIRKVDKDDDGIFETTEMYSANNSEMEFTKEEIEATSINLFGSPDDEDDLYMSGIEMDTNIDTIPDFFESYYSAQGKLTKWDTDFDGTIDVTYKRHSLEKDKPLKEEYSYLINDFVKGNVWVTVLLENQIPLSIKENETLTNVVKGDNKNFYWLGEKGQPGDELNVLGQLNLYSNAQVFQVEFDNRFVRVIKIANNIFARTIEKEVLEPSLGDEVENTESIDSI